MWHTDHINSSPLIDQPENHLFLGGIFGSDFEVSFSQQHTIHILYICKIDITIGKTSLQGHPAQPSLGFQPCADTARITGGGGWGADAVSATPPPPRIVQPPAASFWHIRDTHRNNEKWYIMGCLPNGHLGRIQLLWITPT